MTGVAFFAPLKPPDHPHPSGDRTVARGLIAAIARGTGRPVTVASDLRTREPAGDAAAQAVLIAQADAEIARLTDTLRGKVAVWVSYHNYYKAPDLIGPGVARALNLPYVLIEATRARKRLTGAWAGFAARAEAASDAAQVIFYLTLRDRETLERDRPPHQRLVHLPPFLNRDALPAPAQGRDILSVGMMRPGDKLESYRLIAQTLALLRHPDWRITLVGDGPARGEVAALMAPFGARVRFAGQLDPAGLAVAYAGAGLFLWPGVNEAFGMVYLEAQAAGLAVVAQDRPGVRDVLRAGTHPPPEAGAAALARRLDDLLADPARCRAEGAAARVAIARDHLIGAAATRLGAVLAPLLEART